VTFFIMVPAREGRGRENQGWTLLVKNLANHYHYGRPGKTKGLHRRYRRLVPLYQPKKTGAGAAKGGTLKESRRRGLSGERGGQQVVAELS